MANGHQSSMFWLYFLHFRHIQTISQQLDFRCKSVPCVLFGRLPPALMERARSLVGGCIASTDIDFNCSNHRYNMYPMRPQLCDIRQRTCLIDIWMLFGKQTMPCVFPTRKIRTGIKEVYSSVSLFLLHMMAHFPKRSTSKLLKSCEDLEALPSLFAWPPVATTAVTPTAMWIGVLEQQ